MNLQEHLSRYDHDQKLREHLESMVNLLLREVEVELHFTNSYISFKVLGKKWVWIDTWENSNKYSLYFTNRYSGQHEIEGLQLNKKGIEIVTRSKDFLRFNIYKGFDYTQPEFINFIKEHYQRYKRHKEEGKPDGMELFSASNKANKAKEINYWIFQDNSARFKVIEKLRKGKDFWRVKAHKDKIKKGDKAIIYITSPERGIYATAEITSDFYRSEEHGPGCDIKLEHTFLDEPIFWDEIVNNPILREANLGNEGNIFQSNQKEYEEVLRIYFERKMPKSRYENFNGYDLAFLKIAFAEYLKFREESDYGEKYKFIIIKKANEQLDISQTRVDNLQNVVKLLKEYNPTSGSFVHWSNMDNFSRYASKKPEEVIDLLHNLFDKHQKLSARIDHFLEKAREFQSDISLGTPFFGYLMCAFDSDHYLIYKDDAFQTFCKWFNLSIPFNIGEKYEYYLAICNELLDYFREAFDENLILLTMQDFIYTLTQYPGLRFKVLLKYISKVLEKDSSIINSPEKMRLSNLLKDIHQLIKGNESLKDLVFADGKQISILENDLPPYKTWLAFYPADGFNITGTASLFLGIKDNGIVEYGSYPVKEIKPEAQADLEIAKVEDVSYRRVIAKYTEVLKRFKELNSGGQTEGKEVRKEGQKEKNSIRLPRINFEREIVLKELFFPDEERLIKQISTALKNGKNIILIGPPGTGKSKLAKIICSHYVGENNYRMTTATSDWSTFETIGGYLPESNNQLVFKRGLFLDCFKAREGNKPVNRWLIIDEINRTDIDKAFGSLFSALTGDEIILNYRSETGRNIKLKPQREENILVNDYEYIIPEDWRLIATMNTFDKTSLYEMSYAFMRRFAFIPVTVPNHINSDLINNYLTCWGITDKRFVGDTVKLWRIVNRYRKIGPALIEDIYRYLINSDGDYSSAVIMYLFPQLEGLMEERLSSLLKELYQFDESGLIKNFAQEYFGLERISDESEG